MEEKIEEKINQIHQILKELYPEAVGVNVFVNCEGIEVTPSYRTNLVEHSMRTITNKWIKRANKL